MLEKWEIPTDTSENGIRILPDIAASVRAFLTETENRGFRHSGSRHWCPRSRQRKRAW